MKKLIPLIVLAALFASCGNSPAKQTSCGSQTCTDIFTTIVISFTAGSQPVVVKNYLVTDLRTKNVIIAAGNVPTNPGTYNVVDDSNLELLSAKGDTLQIQATDSVLNKTITSKMVVSGGSCACHVALISGATTVSFN